MGKEITISIPDGKKAEWVNGVLTLVDDKPKDVRERVKTFGGACVELGSKHPLVVEYMTLAHLDTELSNDLLAYMKLRIICAALNEGWEPEYTKTENRYLPVYYLYEKDWLSEKSDEWKNGNTFIPIENYKVKGFDGIIYDHVYEEGSYAGGDVDSRICLKNQELAEYCGKQFIELWTDFYLTKK